MNTSSLIRKSRCILQPECQDIFILGGDYKTNINFDFSKKVFFGWHFLVALPLFWHLIYLR